MKYHCHSTAYYYSCPDRTMAVTAQCHARNEDKPRIYLNYTWLPSSGTWRRLDWYEFTDAHRTKVPSPSSPIKSDAADYRKLWIVTNLNGVTSHKTANFKVTLMRTSNIAYELKLCSSWTMLPGPVETFCGNLIPPFSGYLKLKATRYPKRLLLIYRTSSHIPEGPHLHIHRHEKPVLSELCR